jgi:carbamoyl-phosphate synthase small subunit
MKKALILLENGYYEYGSAFACSGTIFAEFVFNTAMTGYEEILTDPSYKGQSILFTYPLIGNYGITRQDFQSSKIHAEAMIIREYSGIHSNFRSEMSLKEYLHENNILGIEGLDTRALTKQLRINGSMKGGITTEILDVEEFKKHLAESESISDSDMYRKVISDKVETFAGNPDSEISIMAIDYGIKRNIIEDLKRYYKEIHLVPFNDNFDNLLASINFDAVFLSNGPGDPRLVDTIKPYLLDYAERGVPVVGICFGHQLIGSAFDLDIVKLPFGHHGGNHPVLYLPTNKVYISSQNHNYAIDRKSLDANNDWELVWENLFDKTVAGIRHKTLPIYSVQYHPEASPGPTESNKRVFDDFFDVISSALVESK